MKWENIISWDELQALDGYEREEKLEEIRDTIVSEWLERNKIKATKTNEAQLNRFNCANILALTLFSGNKCCDVQIRDLSPEYPDGGTTIEFVEDEFGSTNISLLNKRDVDLFIELLRNTDGITIESEIVGDDVVTRLCYNVEKIYEE
ncbi:MAG: hypothetical protein RR365_01195 [Bacteroides sp.]